MDYPGNCTRTTVITSYSIHYTKLYDLGAGFFPEFLRESTAVWDFYNPPKVVFAASDHQTQAMLETINAGFDAPKICTNYEIAEMVKYADNRNNFV